MSDTKTDVTFFKENTLANDVAGIVTRMQAGEDAFAELYEKTKRYVYYVAVSNNVPQSDVDDVVQETFVHFYKKYNEILNPQSALAWLKRSAFGHSVDHLKKRPGELLMEEDSSQGLMDTDALVAPFEVPEDMVEREDLARILGGIIDGLPEDQRKCIRAFYFNELKVKDIAATYGVPESTVKTHLFRGRKTIESELNAITRKHGVKFVAFAAVPFLSLAFTEKASACAVGLTFATVAQAAGVAAGSTFGATVGASGSTIGAAGATGSIAGGTAGVAGTTAGVGAGAATGSAAATAVGSAIVKGIAIKAAIAVVSVGVISGGTVAAHSYYVDNVLPAIQAESRVAAQSEEYPENKPENAPAQTATPENVSRDDASGNAVQSSVASSSAVNDEQLIKTNLPDGDYMVWMSDLSVIELKDGVLTMVMDKGYYSENTDYLDVKGSNPNVNGLLDAKPFNKPVTINTSENNVEYMWGCYVSQSGPLTSFNEIKEEIVSYTKEFNMLSPEKRGQMHSLLVEVPVKNGLIMAIRTHHE